MQVDVDGVSVKLQIWDTAGMERFASMMRTYYRKAQGAILVYDVTNQKSLDAVDLWYSNLKPNADPNCVCVVAGNKVSDQWFQGRTIPHDYHTLCHIIVEESQSYWSLVFCQRLWSATYFRETDTVSPTIDPTHASSYHAI